MKEKETRVIFLDRKCHNQVGVLALAQMIDQNMPWGIPYCKIHLLPECKGPKMEDFPFSYEFVA